MHKLLAQALIVAVIVLTVILSQKALGVELTYADIEYARFHPSARMPEMPGFKAKEGLAINFETDVIGPVYWRNRIHALTDPGQYRLIGWNFELGVPPLFWVKNKYAQALRVYYEHHSQHLLEGQHPWMKFPVNDSIGFRMVIYSK